MPKKITKNELDTIWDIVARFPEGAPIGKIGEVLSLPIPLRRVHHRLMLLVKNGRLNTEGTGRYRRYRLPQVEERAVSAVKETGLLPLSVIANDIQIKIRQPIQARKPVGYNREFLDDYRPNHTCYLPEHIVQRL